MKNVQKIALALITCIAQTAFSGSSVQKMSPQEALLQSVNQENLAGVKTAL